MIDIKLTEQEISIIMQSLDHAIKEGGYQNAKPIVPLIDKFYGSLEKKEIKDVEKK